MTTTTHHLRWTTGNAKLKATSGAEYRIVGYGIPAAHDLPTGGNTCPGASACRAVCYARQGRYLMPSVKEARAHNLLSFLRHGPERFASMAVEDLASMGNITTVRIHDSGDFFSQRYLDAWSLIARSLPHLVFYAYTKSHHLNFARVPSNLRVTQSLGGLHDALVDLSRPHARIFASVEDLRRAGYVDGTHSDAYAIEGETRIGLVYHGTRKLTDAQAKYFA